MDLFLIGTAYASSTECQLQRRLFILSDSQVNHFANEQPGETFGKHPWWHVGYMFTEDCPPKPKTTIK